MERAPRLRVVARVAALAFGIIAALSAYWFATRMTSPPLGLVSAAAVATLYLRIASGPYLLQYEAWAAALTLLALALGAESVRSAGRKGLALMWLAALAALVAALTRELATYFLFGALLAAFIGSDERRKRIWIPWVAALAVLVVAYVVAPHGLRSRRLPGRQRLQPAPGLLEPAEGSLRGDARVRDLAPRRPAVAPLARLRSRDCGVARAQGLGALDVALGGRGADSRVRASSRPSRCRAIRPATGACS